MERELICPTNIYDELLEFALERTVSIGQPKTATEIMRSMGPAPMDARQYEAKMLEYRARIEPFIRIKTHILSLSMPKITIYKDRTEYTFPAEIQENLDWCDAMIEDIARSMNHGY